MSTKRVLIICFAVGCALFAAILAKSFLGQTPEKEIVEINKVDSSDVLVVNKPLKMGDALKPGSVSWSAWPSDRVLPYMITKATNPDAVTKMEKSRVRVEMFSGEPVNKNKLVTPDSAGFMAAILPKGMRAVSVRISAETGAGGFILPNDKVDILMTDKSGNSEISGASGANTEPVLQNVRVLAIDQLFTENEDGEKVKIGNTATLELEPYMAEILTMAESTGQLTLALRSLADNGDSALGDDGPRLAGEYASNGRGGGKVTVYRYGVPSIVSPVR